MQVSQPALSDLELIINPNDQYDYTSYITQDSKTFLSCSKFLLVAAFLIRVIDRYQSPTYKSPLANIILPFPLLFPFSKSPS